MAAQGLNEETEITLRFLPGVEREEAFVRAAREIGAALGLEVADELEKAVEAHPSHYAPRDKGGRFAKPHPSRSQPRDERGRFRQRLTREECSEASADAGRFVAELTERLERYEGWRERGSLSLDEWRERCAADIEGYYARIYQAGKDSVGNPGPLTAQDKSILSRLTRDELDYLDAFKADIAAGRGTMAYAERIRYYGQAAREVAYVAWVAGDQRKKREIRWLRGPTSDSCADCVRFANMGWLTAPRFYREVIAQGFAPQSGQLACLGYRCRCALEERIDGQVYRAPAFPGVGGE